MGEKQPRRGEETQLRIRETAYLMWKAAGRQHGRSLEYWLAAERELLIFLDDEQASGIADDRQPMPMPQGAPLRAEFAQAGKKDEGKEGASAGNKSAARSSGGSRST